MGRGLDSRSPLSFCSGRVVPVADNSELKHEHAQPLGLASLYRVLSLRVLASVRTHHGTQHRWNQPLAGYATPGPAG